MFQCNLGLWECFREVILETMKIYVYDCGTVISISSNAESVIISNSLN